MIWTEFHQVAFHDHQRLITSSLMTSFIEGNAIKIQFLCILVWKRISVVNDVGQHMLEHVGRAIDKQFAGWFATIVNYVFEEWYFYDGVVSGFESFTLQV